MSLQQGSDDAAWQRLVRIYGPLIFRWCTRCGMQESDAADVSQEVLGDLPRSIHGFSRDGDGATFRGWLWTITRNKIANHCRRWSDAPLATGGTGALQLIEQLPDERPEMNEDVADLHLLRPAGIEVRIQRNDLDGVLACCRRRGRAERRRRRLGNFRVGRLQSSNPCDGQAASRIGRLVVLRVLLQTSMSNRLRYTSYGPRPPSLT